MCGISPKSIAALDAARGAEEVADVGNAAVRIGAWLTDRGARSGSAEAGAATVDTLGGALDRTLAALDPYLMQIGWSAGGHA